MRYDRRTLLALWSRDVAGRMAVMLSGKGPTEGSWIPCRANKTIEIIQRLSVEE